MTDAPETVRDWLGRKVRINDEGIDGTQGEVGTVLAVDDTPWQPSAWVRVNEDRDYPSYRSVNLLWLDDVATGEQGPNWGTYGPNDTQGNHSDGTLTVEARLAAAERMEDALRRLLGWAVHLPLKHPGQGHDQDAARAALTEWEAAKGERG